MKKTWYLALDYGRAWMGMAVGSREFGVSSLQAIRAHNQQILFKNIEKVVRDYEIKEIVLGLPSGELEDEVKNFGTLIEQRLKMKVWLENEHGSSKEVNMMARESQIPVGKLKDGEHSLAAGEILRRFILRTEN